MPKRSYADYSTTTYTTRKRPRMSSGYYASGSRGYYRRSGFYGRFKPKYVYRKRRYFGGGGGRRISAELKFKDTTHTFGGVAIPNSGVVGTSINLISAGNTPTTMVGRRIIIKRITIKGTVTKAVSSNATLASVLPGDNVRIMLVWDKQANGAQAAVADVMDTGSATRGQLNMEKASRFVVLKEWLVCMNMDTSHDGTNFFSGGEISHFKWSKKCFIPVVYDNAPSSAITDIQDNNIFLQAISDTATCTCLASSRIRFADV